MRVPVRGVAAAALLASSAIVPAIALAASSAHADAARPQFGAWGFDLAGRDLSTTPGADFFQYANGSYLKTLVIPSDRARYGSFDALTELSAQRLHDLLEAAAGKASATGEEAKVGAFYRAYMDEARIEALDARPLAGDLAAIAGATDRTTLAMQMGRGNASFFGGLFGVGIINDFKAPDHYAIYLGQAGLGMPDRDYYLKSEFAPQKAKYEAYVAQTLKAVNWPDADEAAKAVVAFETAVADASWSKVEQRDPVKGYNPMAPAELAALAPGFPWGPYLAAADLGDPAKVVVAEKSAFPKLAALYAATPLNTLKAWQAFTLVDDAAPYLSKRFADANFEFHKKTLSGQPAQKPRWKRAA